MKKTKGELVGDNNVWRGSPPHAQDSFSTPPCQNTEFFFHGPSTQLVTIETAACVRAPLRGQEGGMSRCHGNTHLLSSSPHSVPSWFQRGEKWSWGCLSRFPRPGSGNSNYLSLSGIQAALPAVKKSGTFISESWDDHRGQSHLKSKYQWGRLRRWKSLSVN